MPALFETVRRRRNAPGIELRTEDESEAPGLEIAISPDAARLIRERGGQLFVWSFATRGSLAFLEWGTERPGGEKTFNLHRAESFDLSLEPGRAFGLRSSAAGG